MVAANPPSPTPIARFVHPIAGVVAFVAILTFWTATVSAELLSTPPLRR